MTADPITLEIIEGPNYSRDDDGWEHNAYTVALKRGSVILRSPWRQGLGITDDPTAAGVLESMLSDASGFVNARDFEDWCAEYGYDTDSRKAYATFQQVDEQTKQLRDLLADDFDVAVFPVEADDYDSERVVKRLTNA